MDDIRLSPEATVLASRIRTIDRDLDALERSTRESVIRGLHGYGAAMAGNIAQGSADRKHADLLAERAALAQQLKARVDEQQ